MSKNLTSKIHQHHILPQFDFVTTIFIIFGRVPKNSNSQKNHILQELFSRELEIFLTRSKPHLNFSNFRSPLLSNQQKTSIKYTVFDHLLY